MASYKLHTVLNKIQKQVNCIFFINQILATKNFVTTITQTSPFHKYAIPSAFTTSTSSTLVSKLKTHPSPQKHSFQQTWCSTFNSTKGETFFIQRNSSGQKTLGNSAHILRNATGTQNLNGNFHLNVRKMSTETEHSNSNSATATASHLVWVDCEMTGLDPRKDCILEIACLITDAELKEIDTIELVIHKPEETLKTMNEWCITHHTASGLVDRVRQSSTDIAQADDQLLKFVSKYVTPGTAPLVGNSVYMDRMFIINELPKFNNYLHYRIIDISSLKELCKMYNGDLYQKVPKKRLKHRGLNDIEDTLEEFKFYRQHFLKTDSNFSDEHPTAGPYC